ncbi:MAG TPA: NAD+ synthase [Polyangia bacterium]|nr:NAD+ synthase [Polyangia bacterium]
MKVALGQINPTIGDFAGNRRLVLEATAAAEAQGAELALFPELALAGYPPRDLLERTSFLDAAAASLAALASALAPSRTAVIVGFPERLPLGPSGRAVANSAALIEGGAVTHVVRKSLLPTYDVFDEWRYFEPAAEVAPVPFRGRTLGLSICEDIWNDADFWPHRLYRGDPIETLVRAGAELIVNISASPYTMQKRRLRPRMLASTASRWQRPLLYVNQVGGQDDLVFDGASLAFDAGGRVIARGAEHDVDLVIVDVAAGRGAIAPFDESGERSALAALALGTRDYARRCGFRQALLGLSGGIDSALVACIAARALGPDNVLGVAMPSRYSSPGSITDAEALARALGIDFATIPIEPMFAAYLDTLASPLEAFAPARPPAVAAAAADLTGQNLQARIRGAILMALSNRQDRLLLTTGNKSEVATGYCTLYGDMAGGLAVISDAPKTLVYRLSRAVNAAAVADGRPAPIPESTLTKPPSAELRPDQTDQDSLPPYDLLDAILEAHLVEGLDAVQLVARGFERAVVDDVVRRVRTSEYKRRQMPPGLKITGKAFGPGRRYPIARAPD